MWSDSMDPTRFVKVVKHGGGPKAHLTLCRIFFLDKGRLNFAGKAKIPTALFGGPETDPLILRRQGPNFYSRCGFVPASPR